MPNGDGSNPVPADARELMLAEMARAFNIGLGLNGIGGPSSTDEGGPVNGPADTEALGRSDAEAHPRSQENGANVASPTVAANDMAPTISMPPEGSFERFLVDLQLDLRVALTHVRQETLNGAGHATDSPPEPQPEEQLPPNSSQSHPSSSSNTIFNAIVDEALTLPDETPSQEPVGSDTDTMLHLVDAQNSDSEGEREDDDDEGIFYAITCFT